MLVPVILCGGSGTRLWPLSRSRYPKQVLALTGGDSLLQMTLRRAQRAAPDVSPVIVCNEEHRFLVAGQAHELGLTPRILLEPEGRNTAPAVALAALLPSLDGDARLLVLPADHLLDDDDVFAAAVTAGERSAAAGRLVTFGVVPDGPHTGYGYIRHGDDVPGGGFAITRFVEKPDRATAEGYLREGGYFWNSGMFLFRADAYLDELQAHQPAMLAACRRAMTTAAADLDFIRPDAQAFGGCPSDSIDYAVMERTARGVVVPLRTGWSDLGSWEALYAVLPKDAAGNAVVGDGIVEDCEGCLIYGSSRLVSAVGLKDHAVVETRDAVMVVPLGESQLVKKLVDRLAGDGREEKNLHRQVFRPWGSYDSVDQGEKFQVKRLIVHPGAQLSLQAHRHRAEHWIVVQGVARITRDDEVFDLRENESTYIPIGARHRIENPGDAPLHIIEVQSGDYLGEDDIVRFEDRYGRQGTTG